MRRNSKTTVEILFLLLFAVIISLTVFTAPVSAEDNDGGHVDKSVFLNASEFDKDSSGVGVHEDPATFEKNYCLSVDQKEYAITEIDNVVSRIIKPGMSDLEKYYRLAIWENKHVKYDGKFWCGSYNFDFYRHQWDTYGALTDKSVCVGMAITYAVLCHAADLPCKFVRLDPKVLDHTINYIPDINGNAYYIDVTENSFFMSEEADCSFEPFVDKDFAHIKKRCTAGTFEYHEEVDYGDVEPGVVIKPADIKECYKVPFADWFKEYALHENTKKDFRTPYVEKGSGDGTFHASYHAYPAQFSDSEPPALAWFMEDFYKDPETISSKILNKELDEQLLNISGVADSYVSKDADELASDVEEDILIRYFPSSENGEVVPWAADLKTNIDYKVKCVKFDKSKREATVAIEGIGDYTGTYLMQVKLKKANPMKAKGKTAKVKYSKLKKKTKTIKRAKVIKVSKAQGKLSYKFVSAQKGKTNFDQYFKINAKTGKVTVEKGLKKGTYKVKAKVKAAGNNKYGASSWKEVTFKVRVK